MIKYLLSIETEHENIWRDYKSYGIGQYKLVLSRFRAQDQDTESHVEYKYIECLVNEFSIEGSIDMDTKYFDKKNIRDKAKIVGEEDLYGIYYDYDSAFEHGLWGAIRESSLVKCNNPAHQYHCLPDIDDRQKLKSVRGDCIMIMNKTIKLLKNLYEIPDALYESVMKVENNI